MPPEEALGIASERTMAILTLDLEDLGKNFPKAKQGAKL